MKRVKQTKRSVVESSVRSVVVALFLVHSYSLCFLPLICFSLIFFILSGSFRCWLFLHSSVFSLEKYIIATVGFSHESHRHLKLTKFIHFKVQFDNGFSDVLFHLPSSLFIVYLWRLNVAHNELARSQ